MEYHLNKQENDFRIKDLYKDYLNYLFRRAFFKSLDHIIALQAKEKAEKKRVYEIKQQLFEKDFENVVQTNLYPEINRLLKVILK